MPDETFKIALDAITKSKLDEKSGEFGFTDSEEAIRYLVNGFINGTLEFIEELDDETAKRIVQAQQEIKNGQSFVIESGDPIDLDKILGD
jgi:hypothetical protein